MKVERGQARLPNPEMIKLEFKFLLESLSRQDKSSEYEVSQVGKAGLPPLDFHYHSRFQFS